MACVEVVRAYTVFEVLSALDGAVRTMAKNHGSTIDDDLDGGTTRRDATASPEAQAHQSQRPSLIILDSIGAVISPVLGGTHHVQGHALLAAVASMMKQIALSWSAAVLVTNHMVGSSGYGNKSGSHWRSEKRPALGESWQNQAHVRVQLALPKQDGGAHTAILQASTLSRPGNAVSFWLGGRKRAVEPGDSPS